MPAQHRLFASLFAATALASTAAFAAPAPPFHDLLRSAEASPTLAESAAEVAVAEGRLRQARAWRNPELSLEAENFSGDRPYNGFDAAESTLSVSQVLELGGKREARVAAARDGVGAATARRAAVRADFAARLAIAYAEAEAADARVRHAEELHAAAEADARSARLMVEVGREAVLRQVQAAAETDAARANLEEARSRQVGAFAHLTALAGSSVPFDALAETLLDRSPQVANPGGGNPGVTAAEADRDAASARVRVERAEVIPDLRLSAGFRRFEADDSTAFVAGVSLPLPIFDRNRGATQTARAELRVAEARLQRARLEAEAERVSAAAKARSAAARVQAATSGESAAAEAYRLARIGYEAGKLPLLELTNARRALAEARNRATDARLDQVRAEAEAARAAGRIPFGADQ